MWVGQAWKAEGGDTKKDDKNKERVRVVGGLRTYWVQGAEVEEIGRTVWLSKGGVSDDYYGSHFGAIFESYKGGASAKLEGSEKDGGEHCAEGRGDQ